MELMTNKETCIAHARRLGMVVQGEVVMKDCPACETKNVPPNHRMHCQRNRSGPVTHLHDVIKHKIVEFAEKAGCKVYIEVNIKHQPDPDHRIRPDLIIMSQKRQRPPLIIDVSIIDAAPTHVDTRFFSSDGAVLLSTLPSAGSEGIGLRDNRNGAPVVVRCHPSGEMKWTMRSSSACIKSDCRETLWKTARIAA